MFWPKAAGGGGLAFKLGAVCIGAVLVFVLLAALYSSVVGAGRTKAVNEYLEQALEQNAEEVERHREASEENRELAEQHASEKEKWREKAEQYRIQMAQKDKEEINECPVDCIIPGNIDI